MINRIELVEKLKELEIKKQILNENLEALKSNYFNEGSVSIQIQTSDFNYKGDSTSFKFSKQKMIDFVKAEIADTEVEIISALNTLTNS